MDEEDEDDKDDDDSAPVADDVPEKKPELEVVTSRGEVDDALIEKRGTVCVVAYGDKKIELKHVVAVQHESGDKLVPAVLFCSKPFNKTKLARALAGGENVSPFDIVDGFDSDYIEIRLSNDDVWLSCSIDGVSVSQNAPNSNVGFKVADDKVTGQMELTGEEIFGKAFGFEATFDVELNLRSKQPADAPPAELVRAAPTGFGDGPDLPMPDGGENRSSEGSDYRITASTSVAAPLDKVAEFYRRELAADRWKEQGEPAKSDAKAAVRSYGKEGAGLTVTLTQDGAATKIELVYSNDKLAEKDGIKPPKGKAKLLLANLAEEQIVVTIAGKEYKLDAGAGATAADAVKIDVAPGKHTISIESKGGGAKTEEIDVAADSAWGVIVGPNGAFTNRVY